MKKIFVLVLLAAVCVAAPAQRRSNSSFTSNTYVALSGGMNGYGNESFGLMDNASWMAELTAGKWVLNSTVLRVGFLGMSSTNPDSVTQNYFLGHFDFMWDPITTIQGRVNRRRKFTVYPFIGFGFVVRPNSYEFRAPSPYTGVDTMFTEKLDKDFVTTLGVNLEYKLSKNLFGFAEAKFLLYPEGFDRNYDLDANGNIINAESSNVMNLSAGVKYTINKSAYRRRRNGESRNPDEDWFMGVQGGGNYFSYKSSTRLPKRTKVAGFQGEVTFGKYFTSKTAIRVQAGGGIFGYADKNVPYMQVHSDVMLNAHNVQRFVRRRANNISPYAGCGLIKRLDVGNTLFAADAGVQYRRYLNKKSDFTIDLRYTMIPPRFMNDDSYVINPETHEYSRYACYGQNSLSVGLVTVMVGYQYNLGYGNLR